MPEKNLLPEVLETIKETLLGTSDSVEDALDELKIDRSYLQEAENYISERLARCESCDEWEYETEIIDGLCQTCFNEEESK